MTTIINVIGFMVFLGLIKLFGYHGWGLAASTALAAVVATGFLMALQGAYHQFINPDEED